MSPVVIPIRTDNIAPIYVYELVLSFSSSQRGESKIEWIQGNDELTEVSSLMKTFLSDVMTFRASASAIQKMGLANHAHNELRIVLPRCA